jgi:hypothetical protein
VTYARHVRKLAWIFQQHEMKGRMLQMASHPSRWSRRLAALAMICGLGVSILLGGCGHLQGSQTTGNAGNGNTSTSTSTTGSTTTTTGGGNGSGAAQLQDLQNVSNSIDSSMSDLNTDANSALSNWGTQEGQAQP